MGGPGSGRRWHHGAASSTDDFHHLDVRRLQRGGFLKQGNTFVWQWLRHDEIMASIRIRVDHECVILIYRHREKCGVWTDEKYPVRLDWTRCTYGGRRAWFLCPIQGCGRRVALLYAGGLFACRHCYRLAYPSQRETFEDRAMRRADRMRKQLAWEPGIFNSSGVKPIGMRWHTFERLTSAHDTLINKLLGEALGRFMAPADT